MCSNSTFCCNCFLQMDERRPPEKHWWGAWMIMINSWINLVLYTVERYMLIWKLHLHTLLSKHQHFQNAKAHWESMFRCFSQWKLKREWLSFPYTNTLNPSVCTNLQQYQKDRFPPACQHFQTGPRRSGHKWKKKNKGISDNMIFYSFFKWQLNPQGLKEQSLSYHSKFLYPSLSFPVQQYFYLSQKHGLNFGWSHMKPGIGPGDAGGSLLTGCSVILCSVFSITCRSCPQTGSHRGCRNVYPCAWCWMRFTRNQ